MRYFVVVALALIVGIPAATARQNQQSELWITVAPSGISGGNAGIPVRNGEMYVGGPSAAIGTPGHEQVPAVKFSIRAWKEGQKARVVVYAVLDDKRAPGGNTETPIATFTLAARESIQVPEAEKWGGKPLSVSAALR